ncbi:MAG TPA: hypothetical protein PKL65_01060 [Bacteroidales bacterium]|jgi:hypothetical protein|nr:hypothetical protein [Bacteroidales bacterium]HNR40796.1 hypothetical protein [Bacteroidales bacterium]HQG76048.1 hypothetical protein [Bacteroidales bacterium]
MKKSEVKPVSKSKKATAMAKSGGKSVVVSGKTASTGKKTAGRTSAKKQLPGTDEISRKAYEIYQARVRRGESGTPSDDWYKAVELLNG